MAPTSADPFQSFRGIVIVGNFVSPDVKDREKIVVRRIEPTSKSVFR
ncbi:MAG: hypothetical protein IIC21_07430 [Chloroflexi bacterium]|nr:hypothetical protein [Chloroflexota bacterium]